MANDISPGDNLIGSLRANIGRIVTIFTESGGASGCGFTGILAELDCWSVKLVTSVPCAPANPFIGCGCGCASNFYRRSGYSPFGTATVIPINKIVSVCFNQI